MKPSEQDWESFQISVCPLVLTHHTEKGDGRESAVFYSLRLQFHCRKPPASKSRHSLYFRNPFKPNKAAYLLPRLSESINKIKATRFGWVTENNSSFNQGGGLSPLPDTLSIQGRIWRHPQSGTGSGKIVIHMSGGFDSERFRGKKNGETVEKVPQRVSVCQNPELP